MTETHTPQDGPPGPEGPQHESHQTPRAGVDTDHLRDYTALRRSRTDRKIAGVAGGLGRHLNIDPTVLRVVLVVLCFFGGAGLILYAAAWLLVPEEQTEEAVVDTAPATRNTLLILAAVLAGVVVLGDSWGNWGGGFGGPFFPWPVALVGLVVLVVLMSRERSAPPPAGPPAQAQPAAPSPSMSTPAYVPAYPPAPRPDRGPLLFGFTLALVAVALGVLGLYAAAGNDVAAAAYPALALGIVGAMLLVGSVFGRPGGLIALGLLATIALGVTAVTDRYDVDAPRDLRVTPASAAQVQDRYHVFAGSIHLDLSRVDDRDQLDGRTVRVSLQAGDIVVTVPDGVDVAVDAAIDVGGEIDVAGRRDQGPGPEVATLIDGGTGVPTLTLEADATVGTIEVRQPQGAFTS